MERGVSSQAERKPSASRIPARRALPKPSFLLSGQTLSPCNHCTWLGLWRPPGYGRMSGEVAGNSHTQPIGGGRGLPYEGQGWPRSQQVRGNSGTRPQSDPAAEWGVGVRVHGPFPWGWG